MTRIEIYQGTPEYQIISHGNGLAYDVIRLTDFASAFLQGDSADIFREQIDAADEIGPEARRDVCMMYDEVMGFLE